MCIRDRAYTMGILPIVQAKKVIMIANGKNKADINTTGCFYDLVIFPADFLTVKIFSVWNENVVFPYIYICLLYTSRCV